MKCPRCPSRPTLRRTREPLELMSHECPDCHGRWLRSDSYWRWVAKGNAPDAAATELRPARADDARGIRFCPEDGYVLAPYSVGDPLAFAVDQCRTCSGVWFDGGEWESLLEHGLAARLDDILSEDWQDELREAHDERRETEQWRRQLGDDLDRIQEIKTWLDDHPKRSELYAFLRIHERVV